MKSSFLSSSFVEGFKELIHIILEHSTSHYIGKKLGQIVGISEKLAGPVLSVVVGLMNTGILNETEDCKLAETYCRKVQKQWQKELCHMIWQAHHEQNKKKTLQGTGNILFSNMEDMLFEKRLKLIFGTNYSKPFLMN